MWQELVKEQKNRSIKRGEVTIGDKTWRGKRKLSKGGRVREEGKIYEGASSGQEKNMIK